MTDELTRLKELAEKAKHARENITGVEANERSDYARILLNDYATPELILSLIARLEGAEEALKRARKVNESEDRMFEMFITKP